MDELHRRSVRTFPSRDDEFRSVVEELLAAEQPDRPAILERLLADRFPGVVVHEREPVADPYPAHHEEVWYAFRGDPTADDG